MIFAVTLFKDSKSSTVPRNSAVAVEIDELTKFLSANWLSVVAVFGINSVTLFNAVEVA